MQLDEFVARYLSLRTVSAGYARTLEKRTGKLAEHAGHSELAAVFNETTVNSFLASLSNLSAYTVNKYRQDFLAVWRAAADEDRVPYPQARRIRRVRTLPQPIDCYEVHEARALVVAAEHLTGAYANGVPRRLYWPAIIRAAWDSGLRRGDLWKLHSKMIRRDSTAQVVQSKTRQLIVCRFHGKTVRAIHAAGGSLEWSSCEWCFGVHFQEIVRLSCIGRGTFRWLRRGSGSTIDATHPGRGHDHLGNTRGVFDRHYNARLNNGSKPMPPEL